MTDFKAPPRRVLIVDDNEDAANSLALILELGGHQTASVYTAVDALQRAAAFRPEVVLLDIGLPGMDGYEVARTIQRELAGERPRLIALTGYGQASDRASALDAGFDAHVTKPATTDKLLGALA